MMGLGVVVYRGVWEYVMRFGGESYGKTPL
jgi:hypothetical protein